MRLSLITCIGLVIPLCLTPVVRADAPEKIIRDLWDIAYLDGQRAGYAHLSVREVKQREKIIWISTQELSLTLKRFGELIEVKAATGTVETPEGQVLGVSMRQNIGRQQQLIMTGTLQPDGKLKVSVQGPQSLEKIEPFSPESVGLAREADLPAIHKVQAGDSFSYRMFDPFVSTTVTINVKASGMEKVVTPTGEARELLRLECKPQKIGDVQLPSRVLWIDPQTRQAMQSMVEMPLGKLTTVRSTRELATAPTAAPTVDVALRQTIRLSHRIPTPHRLGGVTFRVELENADDDLTTLFSQDSRQSVKNVNKEAKSFELHLTSVRTPPTKQAEGEKVAQEFLESNHFINSADAKVQEHARKALAQVDPQAKSDPWAQAVAIERWVNRNMKAINFTEAMATADHVARTLEGDCTEFAMLTAAMCRVAGIPSRTAIGLVYYEQAGQPRLAYHMWTEVWVRGQWLALDATLGFGSVGPVHLKITDHSWADTRSMKPILPVTRVMMARPRVTVLAAYAEK